MSTPKLHLQTMFLLDGNGRIVGTREPEPRPGPLFILIRGKEGCAWAVRSDVPDGISSELDALAGLEPPLSHFRDAPVFAERYTSLVDGEVDSGPAFTFPDEILAPTGTVSLYDIEPLERYFNG